MSLGELAGIWPILHGVHAGGGGEWLLPLLIVAGAGTALLARWWAQRSRQGRHDHDEPI